MIAKGSLIVLHDMYHFHQISSRCVDVCSGQCKNRLQDRCAISLLDMTCSVVSCARSVINNKTLSGAKLLIGQSIFVCENLMLYSIDAYVECES